jgi:hypothetical protein
MTSTVFESNQKAFEYACEHLDCSLQAGPTLGIVLAVNGRLCSVKIANREDSSVPTGTLTELLARADMKHVCFSAMLGDKVPSLEPGDLVLYTTMPELAAAGKATVTGTVTAKVLPHYTNKSGWQAYSTRAAEGPASEESAATPTSST